MTRRPNLGQAGCQGGLGHAWEPCPAPFGYRPQRGERALHMRCVRCTTIKRVVVTGPHGHVWRTQYLRPSDWVVHEGGLDRNAARMELFDQLGDYVVDADTEPAAQRRGPRRPR